MEYSKDEKEVSKNNKTNISKKDIIRYLEKKWAPSNEDLMKHLKKITNKSL